MVREDLNRERKLNMAEEIKTADVAEAPAPKPEAPKESAAENAEIAKLKAALSKANSEAADWKRQLREKQTEQERADAERAEREKSREARIAELEAKERVNTYKNKLLEAAVDPASADIMAKSLPDGVSDDYFTTLKSYLDNQRQAIETATLNKQPSLSVGMPPTATDAQKEETNRRRRWMGLPPL